MTTPRRLGVGLGYRQEIKEDILAARSQIDFLELITDQYIDMPAYRPAEAQGLSQLFPLLLHGVDLSVGTATAPDPEYVRKLSALADRLDPEWVSDHLCFTGVPELNIGQLTPLAFNAETVEYAARNIRTVAGIVQRPFAVENISYYFRVPGSTMTEAQFITEVIERADCHLLLDLTNLANNAINNHYDPVGFLDQIPLERVLQIHLAGGYWHDGVLLDTHSHPVPADVLELLRLVAGRMPALAGVMIERDQNFPPMAELLGELAAIRAILGDWAPPVPLPAASPDSPASPEPRVVAEDSPQGGFIGSVGGVLR